MIARGEDVGERHGAAGLRRHSNGAPAHLQRVRRRLQHHGRDAEGLVAQGVGGFADGAGGRDQSARGKGAGVERRRTAVARVDGDRLVVDAEDLGADLRERRLAALAEGRDAGVEVDAAGAVRPQGHALVGAEAGAAPCQEARAGIARALDEGREADARQPLVVAAFPTFGTMRGIVDCAGGQLQGLQIITVVVDRAARRGPGQVFGPQHVLPPQLQRVDLQLACEPVDQNLQGEVHLRLAVAAIGPDRRLVGERDAALHRRIGHLVGAGEDHAGELRRAVGRVPGAEGRWCTGW